MAIFSSPDTRALNAARALGADEPMPQKGIPSKPEDVFEQCDGVLSVEWDYSLYTLFVFIDRARDKPVTVLAYDADATGRITDWSSRFRLDEREVPLAVAKLRLLLANDLISYEFPEALLDDLSRFEFTRSHDGF